MLIFNSFFPYLLTRFRKNHNTQNSLLKMLEFKEVLDEGKLVGNKAQGKQAHVRMCIRG